MTSRKIQSANKLLSSGVSPRDVANNLSVSVARQVATSGALFGIDLSHETPSFREQGAVCALPARLCMRVSQPSRTDQEPSRRWQDHITTAQEEIIR